MPAEAEPMTSTTSSLQPPPLRYAEVDLLKAVGIGAIVLIHSVRPRFDPSHSFGEVWLLQMLQFAVPGFLAVSGFLYATVERVPMRRSLYRLRRVVFPYFVAFVCAEAFWMFRGRPRDLPTIVYNFAVGNSFGPYYYVFVLVTLVLITPILARTSVRILWLLFLAGAVLQGLLMTHQIGGFTPFWNHRSPIQWWPYFFAGWLARLHYHKLRPFLQTHRVVLVAVLGTCLLVCWLLPGVLGRNKILLLTTWLGVYFAIATAFVFSCGRSFGGPVRWLSDATYTIYLFHLFFVTPGVSLMRAEAHAFEPLTIASIWLAGLIGSAGIVVAARAILGEQARDVVGA